MGRNLPQPTNGDVIQRALTFEPGKRTLYGLPLLVEGRPFGRPMRFFTRQPFVGLVDLDDGFGSILPTNQVKKFLARVFLVGQHLPGAGRGSEIFLCEPRLFNKVGSPLRVVDISGTYGGSNRRLKGYGGV